MASDNKNTGLKAQAEKIASRIAELEKAGDEDSILALIGYFHHEIWAVRKFASQALVRCGLANRDTLGVINGYLTSSKFKNEDDLYWALQTAAGIRVNNAARYLMNWAVDEAYPKNYMAHLITALARINDTSSVSFLIEALGNENWIVRKEASAALIAFGRNIIPQLQSAFSNEKIEIRAWIAKIIGQILGRDAYSFFKNMLASDRKEMRYYAICALSESDDPQAAAAIAAKVADPSWLIRIQAADILEKMGEGALEYLKKNIVEGSSDDRFHSIKIIQKILKDKAFTTIRDFLNLDDTETKILLLSALAERDDETVFNLLCDSLTEPNYLVQRHAANLLIHSGNAVSPKIASAFSRTQNGTIRYWFIEVLSAFDTRESFAAQAGIFSAASKRQKIQILRSINRSAGDEALDRQKMLFLISALAEEGYSVRNAAFGQLAKFANMDISLGSRRAPLDDALAAIRETGLEQRENGQVKELIASNRFDHASVAGLSTESAAAPSDVQGVVAARTHAEAGSVYHHSAAHPLSIYAAPDYRLHETREYSMSLEEILRQAVEKKASDIHFAAEYPPTFRMNGHIEFQDYMQALEAAHIRHLAYQVLSPHARQAFENSQELDTSYEIKGLARFRVNMYMDMRGIGMVFRVIPYEIPDLDALGVPAIIKTLAQKHKGLVLVTGPTGSGKSTTLASIINFINRNRKAHIITIEDPVEFVHKPIQSKITQRELNTSTRSFAGALRSSLREDPDIILVGEMRDLETIEMAITAAETGHLVLSTVHTSSAANTIDRLIDAFPADKHSQVRAALTEGLIAVVAQSLVPRKNGGMTAAFEIMTMTSAIGNLIKEGKTTQIKDYMLAGKQYGMQILDDSLAELMSRDEITFEAAMGASYNKEDFRKRYGSSQSVQPAQAGAGGMRPQGGFKQGPDDDSLYGMKPKTPVTKPVKK